MRTMWRAGVTHPLDREDHALLELRALARLAVVGHLRVLVHRPADPVADERPHDREALALDAVLHRVRDVAEAAPRPAMLDRVEQRRLRDVHELLGDRRDRADRERARRVGDPVVEDHADVDRDDVAALEAVRPGDAMHDHRVRRGADRAGEAAIALERGRGSLRVDELLGRPVEVERRDALADLALEELQRADEDGARGRHLVDLVGGLADDHYGLMVRASGPRPQASSSMRSVAIVARRWSWTSVGLRVPSKRWRMS